MELESDPGQTTSQSQGSNTSASHAAHAAQVSLAKRGGPLCTSPGESLSRSPMQPTDLEGPPWRGVSSCSQFTISRPFSQVSGDSPKSPGTKKLATPFSHLVGMSNGPNSPGNWVFDMQVLLSEMQKSCSRCKVFASRVAKPECCTTIFTSRPAVFASRVAKPECRTTIFISRPDRLLSYYFTIFFIVLLFHFHSVPSRGFCISGSET